MRRVVGEWLLGGGALLALVTGLLNYFDKDQDRIDTMHREACSRAHEAIRDDVLNSSLPVPDKLAFLQRQLKVAQICDKDAGS